MNRVRRTTIRRVAVKSGIVQLARHGLMCCAIAGSPLAAATEVGRPTFTPPPVATVTGGSVLQVIVSLALVLAAVMLVGWILKRIQPMQRGPDGTLKVVGSLALGQRERVVLLEVNDTWLLLGVTPGQVNTLHSMPKGVLPAHAAGGSPSHADFQGRLKKMMERRNA